MDIDRLLTELAADGGPTGEALREAVAEAGRLAPAVIGRMESAADGAFPLPRDARLIYVGLYVLSAARRSEAFPAFLRFLRHAGEAADYTFNLEITETVAEIAVSLFDGDAGRLVAEIENPAADGFVCWGLIKALVQLALDGRLPRATAVAVLDRFDRERLAPDFSVAWEGWRDAVLSLGLTEFADRLLASLHDGRRPDGEPDLEEWEERAQRFRRGALRPDDLDNFVPRPIGDVVASLSWMRSDAETDPRSDAAEGGLEHDEAADEDSAAAVALAGDEFEWLEFFLASRPSDRPSPTLGWLHGYQTGLAVGPVEIEPSDAAAGVLGRPPAGLAREAAAALDFAAALLERSYEAIRLRLRAGNSTRIRAEFDDERSYEAWALGFTAAMAALEEYWQPLFDDRRYNSRAVLKPILYAATGDLSLYGPGAAPVEIDDVAPDIEETLTWLNGYWSGDDIDALPAPEPIVPVRTGPKIGRNQPCPCGSGKKYKRCCGAAL